jgi:hypothetical protein
MAASGRSRDLDEIVVAALAAGMSYRQAGSAAGLSERTVRRRMGESAFRARVAEQREEHAERVRGLLLNAAPAAAATLATLAAEAESESVRLGAARATLGHVAGRQRSFFDESVSETEIARVITRVIDIAMKFIPDEAAPGFLREVRASMCRT